MHALPSTTPAPDRAGSRASDRVHAQGSMPEPVPMTKDAAARLQANEARTGDGQNRADSIASKAMAAADKNVAAGVVPEEKGAPGAAQTLPAASGSTLSHPA